MARREFPKREVKKSKKRNGKAVVLSPSTFSTSQVEVVKKKRKPKDEDI